LKDAKKVKAGGLKEKAQARLEVLESHPSQNPPPFEKLVGDHSGAYARKANIQHPTSSGVSGLFGAAYGACFTVVDA